MFEYEQVTAVLVKMVHKKACSNASTCQKDSCYEKVPE